MIAIVDYGVGNLYSLASSLKSLGLAYLVTSEKQKLKDASHIILPGVGAFGDAAQKLRDTGLWPLLQEEARNGKPFLGICLGMQLLFDKSFEYGEHEGLGLVPGTIEPLAPDLAQKDLKVPHIGWNSLHLVRPENP
ncbi:MAG: imidazole glycerol phosphate synthase subunit HisH, partial [Oscillospiraceae bacterium]|nr:imidazole glycerol phosphate synthase subunit HisH [Oscillospiraceae bacterium]